MSAHSGPGTIKKSDTKITSGVPKYKNSNPQLRLIFDWNFLGQVLEQQKLHISLQYYSNVIQNKICQSLNNIWLRILNLTSFLCTRNFFLSNHAYFDAYFGHFALPGPVWLMSADVPCLLSPPPPLTQFFNMRKFSSEIYNFIYIYIIFNFWPTRPDGIVSHLFVL